MKKLFVTILACGILAACSEQAETIIPVPFNEVALTDGFWKQRMQTELDVTVPFSVGQCGPAVERFRRCAAFVRGEKTELPETHRFISSDLYKVMEGVAYSLMARPDEELEAFMDSTIDLIEQAQQEDGYLYISHICRNPFPGEMGEKPYSWVVHSHELYNVGHLYEAAVAYYQATGKRKLLDIAIKNARHVNRVFFEGDPNYNEGKPVMQAPGHEEIELALCKLYRVTGDRLYLDMAKKFLDIRGVTYRPEGEGVMAPTYAQQHKPVAEQTEAVGHAVRAAYLYTAMAQVDALTGRHDYDRALNAIWNNLVSTRMHITGGLGAVEGMEGFGSEFELPNKTAYNETCAAVGNVFFNHGLFLASGDAKYLDIAEVSLFNNALAGINLAGDRFFYINPLETDGKRRFNHGLGGRAEWFGCACCPPNISRMILQVPGYMYAYGNDKIYLTLYGSSRTSVSLKEGAVAVEQRSDYPFDGHVRVSLSPEQGMRFGLCLRIPTWCTGEQFMPGGLYPYKNREELTVKIRVNGQYTDYKLVQGFAVVERTWEPGDIVDLELPMPVRYVGCDPRVKENVGLTAITRGPLVYCAEEADNGVVQQLSLADGKTGTRTIVEGPLKGIPRIETPGKRVEADGSATLKQLVLIPYYAWCNRGDDQSMTVWIHDDVQGVVQANRTLTTGLGSRIAEVKASSVMDGTNPSTVYDGKVAKMSDDPSVPKWIAGADDPAPELEVVFDAPTEIASVALYWVTGKGVEVPKTWEVYYLSDGRWRPMQLYVTDSYQTEINRFNVVHPAAPIRCKALRIRITPQPEKTIGISELYIE